MYPVRRLTNRKLVQLLISLLVVLAGYYLTQNPSALNSGTEKLQQSQPGLYRVEEASDGDTIIVNMNGTREIVRFIGIDTPETHHPDRPVQCYGREASEFTRLLLVDKAVRLEADPLNTNRDRYDRLLRYVYLPDGTLVNSVIIEEGYGFSYTSFPFSKTDEFNALEYKAKENRKGLWGKCSVTVDAGGGEQTGPAN